MFNNIIYFIIVLLIFSMGQTAKGQVMPLFLSFSMMLGLWLIFTGFCKSAFKRLIRLYESGTGSGYAGMYSRIVLRLSVISILIFSLDVHVFNLKYWVARVPLIGNIDVFQGLAAITVFLFYLSTVWYFAHRSHNLVFGMDLNKKDFIFGNIRLNIPVIFPWLLLSIVFDLISIGPWHALNSFTAKPLGQNLIFGILLFIAMIFLPSMVMYFWGCRPLESSLKVDSIKRFFKNTGFKYRALVNWPLLGGRMMTAGIMGIIPRFRYIMITDSLMDVLTPDELNGVMAHEAGHAKYNHQLMYSLFFFAYFVLMTGFFYSGLYSFLRTYLVSLFNGSISYDAVDLYLMSSFMLLSLVIYFRFIMGFFMRHFERQADTYAALTLDDPNPIINSLEKIAYLSGKIRDLPSWHHFSIKQRVDFLAESHRTPGLINRHKKMLGTALVIYFVSVLIVSYLLYFTPSLKFSNDSLQDKIAGLKVEETVDNIDIILVQADIFLARNQDDKAVEKYETVIRLDPDQSVALNNLAWILVTSDDPGLRDDRRGLELALKAVELERSATFLDTLAEAYWVNGNSEMAVNIIKEAIRLDKNGNPHFRKQLEKFHNSDASLELN